MMRALTMLNTAGDTTIAWDESSDDAMLPIIERKMAEGISFFIIEPRMGGLVAPAKIPLETAADALKGRALQIPDADLAAFVGEGQAQAISTPKAPVRRSRKTKDAAEVMRSESVGVRQLVGG